VDDGPITPAASNAPKEGDTKTENGINYTFYQGNWVVNNGQTVDGSTIGQEAGFNYGSNGGGWILLDGQTKTDSSGVNYISSAGQWVVASTGTAAPKEGDTQTGSDGFKYVFTNQRWTLADGQTRQQGGDNWHTSAGSWVDDGPITPAASNAPKEGDTRLFTSAQGDSYHQKYTSGLWVLSPQEGDVMVDARATGNVMSTYTNGQWVTKTVTPNEGDTKTGPDGFNCTKQWAE
jgi:hypothetical protein